ncbi:YbaB/EbfC family nucleoid-associated protein [Nocardia sp. NEAU-G5]|uniref:YbaB/EbfC family nucleoid-associated protein n=1 Tax=Nocardia albiluteola TaxID=2842303 RepID=A0ABS6AXT2_9NOCA|nr:YbaB/EbfC family nucleoid-associated protein [Nocardia albiluteola]MBU3062870.1 YbaB/EbfC family nucleoid-associated protein [Nocardia albiluteola]
MAHTDTALEQMMARAAEVQRGIAAIRCRGESLDGAIAVTVDATGRIRNLTLADDLAGIGLPDLATEIVRAHTAACDLARETATGFERALSDDRYAAALTNQLAAAGLTVEDEFDSSATEQDADATETSTGWDNPAAVGPLVDVVELPSGKQTLESSW